MLKDTTASGENKNKAGFLRITLFALVLFVALMTLISGWVSLFNPAHFWYIAVTGLGFPLLFCLNIILFILLAVLRNKLAFIPLAAFLFTCVHIPTMIQLGGKQKRPEFTEGQSDEIKLMSFNVRLFDLYNWTKNNETRQSIYNLFSEKQPDILCIQEFYSSERHNFENAKALSEILKASNSHLEYPITLHGSDHWGIATYTKYPIVKKGVLYFDKKTANVCIYTDILISSDTVRVFNCHLQSVRFGTEEYKFLQSLGQDEDEQTVKRTRNILSRLKTAFIKRASQADLISKNIAESPYPVIVCGDFNDTPLSYTYKKITENLQDAFRESGTGFGTSYAGPIPGLRIDYLLHSSDFTSYNFHTLKVKLSDHFPVEASLILNLKK